MPPVSVLLSLETSGNQAFIFASNRTAECAGASELLIRAISDWVPDDSEPGVDRVLQRSAGKALLLCDDRTTAVRIAQDVTFRALREAPGLIIDAGIVDVPTLKCGRDVDDAILRVSQRASVLRASRPSADGRFPRIPVAADCASTTLPAEAEAPGPRGEGVQALSAVAFAKARAYHDRVSRLRRENALSENALELLSDADKLDRALSGDKRWIAVVHADGNGVGAVLQAFAAKHADDRTDDYLKAFASLSGSLQSIAESAFRDAAASLPVVPLILGGDDMTALVPGGQALRFATRYLRAVEQYSQELGIPLSAAAGVAVVKPHFPFSSAYRLAEDLAANAKSVKREVVDDEGGFVPASALDFHVVYDSTTDLDAIRARAVVAEGEVLHGRPYVVSSPEEIARRGASDAALRWVRERDIADLERRRAQLDEKEVSRSQLAALRSALQEGAAVANARARIVADRHSAVSEFLGQDALLFTRESNGQQVTRLLDVLEARDVSDGPIGDTLSEAVV